MAGSRNTSTGGSKVPSTIEDMEEAMVRVHALWRRSPGGGKWPFAGDGPWHLAQGEVGDIKGDWSETLIETDSGKQLPVRKVESREPRTPLSSAEVDERDRVTAWVGLVADEQLRKAVWLATEALARGEGRVPWTAIAAWVRWERTPNALKLRYRMALGAVVCGLNGWPSRRARVLAA
ncbi:hypothetical protein K3172_12995 [Qipengyuania sp. 6B39]|uniref:hypothetical protein n=1 Tax=Qipengyuania proteolytica TaxID=2867239 RepID=UPI001C8A2C42|nr:hypothetical protein [Qipengyuania proteolytica]MBX7496776.1 hypothetical protein [Qipengyuania proteolytica]